jgi:hypothetical protein
VHHPVRSGDLFVLITQNGIFEIEIFGETPIRIGRVAADGEEGDIETIEAGSIGRRKVDLFPTIELDDERLGTPAGTQRVALTRSTAGKGLGKPGQDDDPLAAVIDEAMGLTIAAGKLEGGRAIADRQPA